MKKKRGRVFALTQQCPVSKQFRNKGLRKQRVKWELLGSAPQKAVDPSDTKGLCSHMPNDQPTSGCMQKMNMGEKYVEETIQCMTRITPMEEHEPARRCCCCSCCCCCCCQKHHPTKRPKREDLLSLYLHMQNAKNHRSCENKKDEIFILPFPDSLRRDSEVLQRFIKMHEPPGDVVHEEILIVTEENKSPKKKNNLAEVPDQVQEGQSQSGSICSPRPGIRAASSEG